MNDMCTKKTGKWETMIVLYTCANENHLGHAFAPIQTQWYISDYNTVAKYQRFTRVQRLVIHPHMYYDMPTRISVEILERVYG